MYWLGHGGWGFEASAPCSLWLEGPENDLAHGGVPLSLDL